MPSGLILTGKGQLQLGEASAVVVFEEVFYQLRAKEKKCYFVFWRSSLLQLYSGYKLNMDLNSIVGTCLLQGTRGNSSKM